VDEQARTIEELLEAQGEAQVLRELFNQAADTPEYRRVIADVIGQDTNPALQSILIDKGIEDGVRTGMPVEAARGPDRPGLSRHQQRRPGRAIDRDGQRHPRAAGHHAGHGHVARRGARRAADHRLDRPAIRREVGELVMTSGTGRQIPGEIWSLAASSTVERNEAELFQRAVVQPAVDFRTLETVFVVTDFNTINTEIFSEEP
jgi:rod shape-determining protein MreC